MCKVSAQGWGLHDTLSLLTVIMKVLVECIIEPAIATYVSDFEVAIKRKKKKTEVGKTIMPYQ